MNANEDDADTRGTRCRTADADFSDNEKGIAMNIGDRVRIKADEPEYCNKHGKEGDYMGTDEEYNFSVVWFDDGTKLYFYPHELEVIECPMNKQSQN